MIEIHLGGKTWPIRKMTLRQLSGLENVLLRVKELGSLGGNIGVVKIALTRDHSKDAEILEDIEATVPDLEQAAGAILGLAGYLPAPIEQAASNG